MDSPKLSARDAAAPLLAEIRASAQIRAGLMRILVTGTTGQVGERPGRAARRPRNCAAGEPEPNLDLAFGASIEPALSRLNPDLIINPAAYTAVDQAEDEPDLAHQVNAEALEYCALGGCAGRAVRSFLDRLCVRWLWRASLARRRSPPRPLSVYGASKFAGEEPIRAANGPHLIVRTSWVYAAQGRNFLRTIARLAAERQELRIVSDQIGAPTSARVIADAIAQMLAAAVPIWRLLRRGAMVSCISRRGRDELAWICNRRSSRLARAGGALKARCDHSDRHGGLSDEGKAPAKLAPCARSAGAFVWNYHAGLEAGTRTQSSKKWRASTPCVY